MLRASRPVVAAVALSVLSLVGITPAATRPVAAEPNTAAQSTGQSSTPASGQASLAEKRAEADRLSKQLAEQGRRISVLAEEYNEARLAADDLDARAERAATDLARTDAETGTLRSRLKQQAVESYVRGGAVPALAMLASNELEDDIAVRRQYVDTVTGQVGDTLDELRAVKRTLTEQQQELASARASAKQALAEVERSRSQAVAAQTAHERLLAGVRGEVAELVAAEEARKAAAEARRVQAELDARRGREAAAAREASRSTAGRTVPTTAAPTTAAPTTAGRAAPRDESTTSTTARRAPATTVATTAKPAPANDGGSGGGSAESAPAPSPGATRAIQEAERQLGKPYRYGGSGPDDFDCSGLTSWAWRAGGKSLPHSSRAQWSATSRVAIEDLQPGDLVFYGEPIHHVGLYVGNGQMIEAPETGKNVRYASIFRRGLVGAGRVN